MKILKGNMSEIDKLRELWKAGFGEGEEFLSFYMPKYFDIENAIFIEENGLAVASLVTEKHDMIILGEKALGSYIMGVVTHPDYRKSGLAKRLLNESILNQYKENILISNLIPAEEYLFDIYKKYGFAGVYYVNRCIYSKSDKNSSNVDRFSVKRYKNTTDVSKEAFNLLHEFYIKEQNKLDVTIIKNKKYFEFVINEFLLFEGEILICYNEKNEILSCGFLSNKSKKVFIKEILYIGDESKDILVENILNIQNVENIEKIDKIDLNKEENEKFAMARIINIEKVLERVKIPEEYEFSIKARDDIITENNNIYKISKGKAKIENDINPDMELDISEFSELILKYGMNIESYQSKTIKNRSYINLMLN